MPLIDLENLVVGAALFLRIRLVGVQDTWLLLDSTSMLTVTCPRRMKVIDGSGGPRETSKGIVLRKSHSH